MWFSDLIIVQYLVVVSDSQRKGSNTPSSIRSSCRWRQDEATPLLCVPFSALTLMIRWQEGHPAHQNPISLILRCAFPEKMEEEKPRGTSWYRDLVQSPISSDHYLPWSGGEVLRPLCLHVCLLICLHISKTTRPNFTKFSAHYLWPWLGLLW